MSELNISHRKMSDFISFSLFGFTLVVKLRNFNFKSHWDILIFLTEKNMASDFNMSHEKMFHFVAFSFLGFTLVIKLRNFDFESHWNTLIFFDQRKWCQIWLFHGKQCMNLVKCRCLSRILAMCKLRNTYFKLYWNSLIFFN